MQLPGFAAKLLATERRLAGIAKAAGSRAISAASAKARASADALAAARRKPALTDRRLLIAALALALALVLLLMALIIGSALKPREAESSPSDAAPASRAYFDALLMPAPLPGELPFPLARERKSRYTEAEVRALRPDLGSLPLGDSVERRKAELETIYNAVD